eukprot:736953-Amorphochlora_amoeboformis.AAC.1
MKSEGPAEEEKKSEKAKESPSFQRAAVIIPPCSNTNSFHMVSVLLAPYSISIRKKRVYSLAEGFHKAWTYSFAH